MADPAQNNAFAPDITYIGMALVDSIIRGFDPAPVSASGYRAESNTLSVGGEAVNGSMAAAKLGCRARILTALGEDAAGDLIVHTLQQCGVDTSAILRSKEHPTPVTTMFVRPDGSRRSITNTSHRYQYHPEQCPEAFAGSRAIVLGSLFRAPFADPAVVHGVLCAAAGKQADPAAAAAGVPAGTAQQAGLLFSPASSRPLLLADTKLSNFGRMTLDDLRDSLPLLDYIFPNEDEARFYSGKTDPDEMAEVFLSYGIRNVIIKLGADGCLLKSAAERIRLPGEKINAADATGAGDNFIAGFVSELLRGADTESALRFANACGAICTTAVGAGTALKNREQVLAFLTSPPTHSLHSASAGRRG